MSKSNLIPGINLIAVTSEENGEISCTVEETNRIRALLGLRPLSSAKRIDEEKVAVDNFRLKKEQEETYVIHFT